MREMQRSIAHEMARLDPHARQWIAHQLPDVYAQGALAGAADMGGDFTWSLISHDAVQNLAGTMHDEMLQATRHVNASTKALVRAVAQDAGLRTAIEGQTARQAATEMRRILAKQGIAAITYANGARHGLGEYAEMAIRTNTAKAYNYGVLNGAAQNGCVWWECLDGPDCGWSAHDSGELALGKIVTRDEALAFPISHPNCRRAFGARPDLTERPEGGRDSSVSAGQVAAQRAQDAARQAKQERAAARRAGRVSGREARKPAARLEKRAAKVHEAPARQFDDLTSRINYLTDMHEQADYVQTELDALEYYQDAGYRVINDQLRFDQRGLDAERIDFQIDVLKNTVNQPLPDRLTAFRGADLDPAQFQPGAEITDRGFMSTSLDETFSTEWTEGTANPVVFEIDVPKGTRVSVPDPLEKEAEMIFAPGTRMQVIRVEQRSVARGNPHTQARKGNHSYTKVFVRMLS